MHNRSLTLTLLALGAVGAAQAEPPVAVQREVSFLLGYVEGSGCGFQRNGTWYTSREAQAHLRDKYQYLVRQDLIASTEHFIERAATESSLSGSPYQVKCGSGPTITSRQWLSSELEQLRARP